jgi:hypothetical protein
MLLIWSILAYKILEKQQFLKSDALSTSLTNFMYSYFEAAIYIFTDILISLELCGTKEYFLVGKHIPAISNAKGTIMAPQWLNYC